MNNYKESFQIIINSVESSLKELAFIPISQPFFFLHGIGIDFESRFIGCKMFRKPSMIVHVV